MRTMTRSTTVWVGLRGMQTCTSGQSGVPDQVATLKPGPVQVIDNAREVWDKDESKTALRKRVSFVGGDFFKKGARILGAPVRYTASLQRGHTWPRA